MMAPITLTCASEHPTVLQALGLVPGFRPVQCVVGLISHLQAPLELHYELLLINGCSTRSSSTSFGS
jgi:hypothetical protein